MENEKDGALPLGLGMALAQRPAAMERFTALSAPQRQTVIAQAHAARSKSEMAQLVEQLLG